MNLLRLVLDNLFRNPLRTIFTSLATMVMVLVVTVVFSILSFLSTATTEKAQNLKGIVTERWQIPSQMPWAYANGLAEGGPHRPGDQRVDPQDAMTWSFYGGSTDPDPKKRSINTILFAFALEPRDLTEMMDGLDDLQGEQKKQFDEVVAKLEQTKTGLIVGKERLANIGKKVGDKVKVYSFNYRGIDLEFDIVGEFPEGRYDPSAAMRADYLQSAMDAWSRENAGKPHAMAGKSLNLVWLRLKDRPRFDQVADQILTNPSYSSPAVKFETASSGIATFLEAYRDLIWGMQWLLAPAILFTLSLVISNSISISVRERRMEFAVLKVLGYRPWQILFLVLTEAILVGVLSGTVSAGGTYLMVNHMLGGLKFPIAFFGTFYIAAAAWWWGAAIGGGTALAGSIGPAWAARTVRVADIFAKTA
ncbi:MAG: ABC transporter permease [Planctomycetaceae bacterium]|nr:ABC transporter permease [Planctomycetaceae bacterium]